MTFRIFLAVILCSITPVVACATNSRSGRSDLGIRSVPTGDGSTAVVLVEADRPIFSIRVRSGRLEGFRIPAEIHYRVVWHGSDDEKFSSLLQIWSEKGGIVTLAEVIAVSSKDGVSFADDETFKRVAAVAVDLDGFVDEVVRDLTDEEKMANQRPEGTPGKSPSSNPSQVPGAPHP